MKLFLAGFALLASVSTVSFADDVMDTLLVTSTPRDRCNGPCGGKASADIKSQYEWINQEYPEALGVVINGDLTEMGADGQREESQNLLNTLKVPYFFGLGDNEYMRNLGDQYRDAIDSVMWLADHVDAMRRAGPAVNFDFVQHSGYGYSRALLPTVDAMGSLGYGVDLGKVYLIQLNENMGSTKGSIAGTNHNKYYFIRLNPIRDWLEATLEYAAQNGKIIVVNKHTANLDPDVLQLLDKYDVRLRFASAHRGDAKDQLACSSNAFHCLEYSETKDVLRVVFDYEKRNYRVARINNLDDRSAKEIVFGQFNQHPIYYPKGTLPKHNLVISIKNVGGYVADSAKVRYKGPLPDGNTKCLAHDGWVECNSGKMELGNVFMVDIPKEASEVSASFAIITIVPWITEVFNQINLDQLGATSLCYNTWGTFVKPQYARQDSSIVDSRNRCN